MWQTAAPATIAGEAALRSETPAEGAPRCETTFTAPSKVATGLWVLGYLANPEEGVVKRPVGY